MESEAQLEEERRLCYVAMTRAEKRLYLSHARVRRRYGGSPPEPCIPSRFLEEVPGHLIVRLNDRQASRNHVDLFSEQATVREAARRSTYTGKTYNSLDHITQFFEERGIGRPAAVRPGGAAGRAGTGGVVREGGVEAPRASKPAHQSGRKPPQTGFRPGATVYHPKYGRGTLLRKEGDGEEAKLTISFAGHGLKKLIAKYASLKTEN
jgi:DNA helicase-2/ATP-dependent DNA helicase PcrA